MQDQNNSPFSNNGRIHSTENQILGALPEEDRERLRPHLETVTLSYGKFIYQPEERIDHVYFPISGMISITSAMPDGKTVEIAMVGCEGMAGIDVVLGADSTPYESIVQIPGAGFRMKTEVVRAEFHKCGALQDLLLRYTRALLIQGTQGGACHRLHTLEQKFAMWLLTCRDRTESDRLPLTHEFIAMMLGVQRPTVSLIAANLHSAGVIEYKRGKIDVLDAPALEGFACDCYMIIKDEYAALTGRKI